MSYLNPVRLHFFGKFQAAPSTVNNDPLHYNNATFQPSYQKLQTQTAPNGWWNPMGDASWRLIDCKVTSAWIGPDQPAAAQDPIHSYIVADSDRRVAAKIVDLDPEQQLVSEVWGLQVRIARADGTTVLRGEFATAPFTGIWDRAAGPGQDANACAAYQSVLENLEWGDIADSPFLQTLKAQAKDGLLSIKFNVDGYNMQFGAPDFTLGRIAGTIGPATSAEPRHFVLGRHLMTVAGPVGNFFAPAGKINFCEAVFEEQPGKLYLDLGNALPSTTPGGPMEDLGALTLVVLTQDQQGDTVLNDLATIDYLGPDWYRSTAGVVALPADGAFTSEQIATLQTNPIGLAYPVAGTTTPQLAISEPSDGLYVRADQFVYRMDPGDRHEAKLYATKWGKPYPDARIISFFDASQLQAQAGSQLGQAPPVVEPLSAVNFPTLAITDANGTASLPISVSDPGAPRGSLDGQVYGIRPMLEETLAYGVNYPESQWDFISVLLWSGFKAEEPLTWFGTLQPILTQYANLYPVMSRFLNLADYDSICANLVPLVRVFGLPLTDPDSMPVTRDLSAAKRKAILTWLTNLGADGKPLKGTPKPPVHILEAAAPGAETDLAVITRGGKSAAAAKRRMLQRA